MGFVEDVVFVDKVLSETKFRATVYVKRPTVDRIYIVIDKHNTKNLVDGKKVTLTTFVEVTGTEKSEFGETHLVLTVLDLPMDKIKAAVLTK